jgi:hypothetical protein
MKDEEVTPQDLIPEFALSELSKAAKGGNRKK